jgi:acetyltransferase
MALMIEYVGSEGLDRIEGQVLSENTTMLRMCAELGFHMERDPTDPTITLATLSLKG